MERRGSTDEETREKAENKVSLSPYAFLEAYSHYEYQGFDLSYEIWLISLLNWYFNY